MNLSLSTRLIALLIVTAITITGLSTAGMVSAEEESVKVNRFKFCTLDKDTYHVVRTIKRAVITGYSSTIWQTDSTPFITADGTDLRTIGGEGVIATNILPMGTMVRIKVGEEVIIAKVRDRMNAKYNKQNRFDLYFHGDGEVARKEAIKWGVKVLDIEILES